MSSITTVLLLLALGQDPGAASPAGSATLKGADLDLLQEIRRVGQQVERIRVEPFLRPPIGVRAPDEMRQVAATIRAYNVIPRERLDARGRAWADLGLGQGDSPRLLLTTLASDLKGIGFDPEGNRLLVEPGRLSRDDFAPDQDGDASTILLMTGVRPDEPLVSHLLMHVRQRERAGGDLLSPTTDRLLAGMAWAEGEANLVAVRYLFEGLGLSDEILTSRMGPGDVLDGRLLPPDLDRMQGIEGELVRFVYLEGFFQAVEQFRAGGWAAVSRASSTRLLTRDVLHPDRAGRPLAPFEAPAAPRAGLELLDQDSLGEQGVVALVSSLTAKDNLGLLAGDGWDGDALYRWEGGEADAGVTVWLTRWTSDEAATDFDYAITRGLAARFPSASWQQTDDGSRHISGAGRTHTISRSGGAMRITIAPAP